MAYTGGDVRKRKILFMIYRILNLFNHLQISMENPAKGKTKSTV